MFIFVLSEGTQPHWLMFLVLTDDVTCQMPKRVLLAGEGGTEEGRKEGKGT
jgi:hypothetical protein